MESKRQDKINRLIQKDLSEIIRDKSKDEFFSTMITVTKVSITSDLSYARVYVSIFELKYKKEDILKLLKEKTPMLRKLLGDRERFQLRIIPELMFYIDDTLDYKQRIDELLSK
jgi:ribosome-binding factor A